MSKEPPPFQAVPWTQAPTATPLADLRAVKALCPGRRGAFHIVTTRALLEQGLARWPNSEFIRAALAYLDARPELETTP